MRNYLPIWVFILSVTLPAAAQEQLEGNFAALRIPLHLELDKSGFLVDLHQWIMARAQLQVDLTIVPAARAKAMFEAEKVDGLYPSWVSAKYAADVLYTVPFMQVDHFIYSMPGSAAFSSLTDLKGRRLGVVQNYDLGLDFRAQEGLHIEYARNSQTLITLLLSGRVDAIILSNIEVNALQRAMSLETFSFDATSVITTKYLVYVLLNNAKGMALHERIDNAIVAAQASGALQMHVEQAVNRFK